MSTPITPNQILTDVESVASFVGGFFPGAAPAIQIAEQIVPLVAPGVLAAYQAIFGAKPSNVTDASWLALLQTPSMLKSTDDYIADAMAQIMPATVTAAQTSPTSSSKS